MGKADPVYESLFTFWLIFISPALEMNTAPSCLNVFLGLKHSEKFIFKILV